MGITRQLAAVDDLVRRAGRIDEVEAVVLIGSLAAETADVVSDVDAIVVMRDGLFAAAFGRRHELHSASVPACWDHAGGREVAAHKWIDDNGVLVEVLLGTPSGPMRVAEPARVVLGDPAVLGRTRRRPPISRAEMTGSAHPIEARYDRFKEAVRGSHRPGSGGGGPGPT